jgi:transposase-like protein
MSGVDSTFETEAREIRRLEVINGALGRRHWSPEAKARIVAESLAPGVVVSEVARRHDFLPQQLFTWRHQAQTPVTILEDDGHNERVIAPTATEDKDRTRAGVLLQHLLRRGGEPEDPLCACPSRRRQGRPTPRCRARSCALDCRDQSAQLGRQTVAQRLENSARRPLHPRPATGW